jgi:site-specific DNA recombinase
MFSLGLVGKDGKPLHLSTIQKILTNPFYYGHFRYRGEVHQGSHKPMISKKLFDQIQEALVLNGKPRKKRGPKNFLFLNFAVCGGCGYAITAERRIKKSGLKFVYYRCTHKSKTQNCSQSRFLREEKLAEQVKENCQKVSLPDVWRERYLNKLKVWENENRQTSDLFAKNFRKKVDELKTKISRLTHAYLEGAFELAEFQQKKNALTSEKKTLEEKLSDFERKGNHWFELTRNWILEANQAKNLILSENFSEMKNFLKTIGSNRRLAAGKLTIDFKNPWNYLAEIPAEARGETPSEAINSIWWTQAESNR